ncbi:hypothetical protein [Streptomyces niger]|uniref:hypothetical protein n=1 Tax=Streptomyces niger TaxID=66373 RepID=UPI00069A1AF8|nr:hypothetical protein [Streptomyces niger]
MGGGSRSVGAAPGDDDGGGPAALGELLGAAVRAGSAVTPEGEERAVAAFHAARNAREHATDVRRRGDRRPRAARRVGRPVRAALGALLASLTLGGVAVASMGHFPGSAPERPRPSPTAPGRATPPSLRPDSPTGPVAPLIEPPHTHPEPPRRPGKPTDHHGPHDKRHDKSHDSQWHGGKSHQGKGPGNEGEANHGRGGEGQENKGRTAEGRSGQGSDGERRHARGTGHPHKQPGKPWKPGETREERQAPQARQAWKR